MKDTTISWTDATFNIAWGCRKVSPGCAHCYAERLSARYGFGVWGPRGPRRTFGEAHWNEPLRWNAEAASQGERRRVFASSMCDVFEDHPTIDAERTKLWPLIDATPSLDWQILTKRPERIRPSLPRDWGEQGRPNVWLGVSIESAEYVRRADVLRTIPAVVRFVSYEPALGPLADALVLSGLDWVIYGGESGARHRAHEVQWARDLRDKCRRAGVAFFYKQGSGFRPGMDATLDGRTLHAWPTPRFGSPYRGEPYMPEVGRG